MQISAVGKQDVETVLNPELTFFKGVTRRHTPFAMEPKVVEFQNQVVWGRRFGAEIPRIGDLATRVWFYIELGELDHGNGGAHYTNDVGRAMFDHVQLTMGTVIYETLKPEIMHAWEELTTDSERQLGKLTGKASSRAQLVRWAKQRQHLYVPLDFFFCTYENALPLVAMHLTDLKVYVKLHDKERLVVGVDPGYVVKQDDAIIHDTSLLVETIVLDDTEREWFVNTPLKWLMHQWQESTNSIRAGVSMHNQDLVFNHPVKELVILYRKESQGASGEKNYFNFCGLEEGVLHGEAFKTMGLTVNSNVRVQPMSPFYYRIMQNRVHHTRIPSKHIYVYSFALYPEDNNPSGSMNFSRLDNVRLLTNFSKNLSEPMEQFVFAHSINSCTLQKGVMLLTFAS